jgi:hypothetical protein
VAVRVVDAVKDPVTAVFPVALPMLVAPVPPVPMDVTPDPLVLMLLVPVAVIPPVVATSPVEAVRLPVTAVFPVALPMLVAPVPPVPMLVTPEPVVLMFVVPVTDAPPVVTVNPVPAVTVVVAAREVVVVKEPGAVIADGRLHVMVLVVPVVVIWLAVPRREMFPPDGEIAPPLSPVNVATAPVAPPKKIHVPGLLDMYTFPLVGSISMIPPRTAALLAGAVPGE